MTGSQDSNPPLPSTVVGPSPLLEPGFGGCILEVQAFVRGARPGLERLKRVLPVIFDAYLVYGHEERCDVLRACNLIPVTVDLNVSFLVPAEEQSPAWTRKVCPRRPSPSEEPPSITLGSPA